MGIEPELGLGLGAVEGEQVGGEIFELVAGLVGPLPRDPQDYVVNRNAYERR